MAVLIYIVVVMIWFTLMFILSALFKINRSIEHQTKILRSF